MKNNHTRLLLLLVLLAAALTARAQPAAWTVNAKAFQFSMNMVARIETGGAPNQALNNSIAAFSGSEIRGLGTPVQVGNQTYYFMNMYSNSYLGDKLYFMAYIGTGNKVFESTDTVVFYHHDLVGDLQNPRVLQFELSSRPIIFSLAQVNYLESSCTPGFVIDVDASDDQQSEGNGLKYNISGGVDSSRFQVDSLSGVLTWKNFTPDFEHPADADSNNVYLVDVRVRDLDGNVFVQQIAVRVVDDLPPSATCPAPVSAFTGDDNPGDCNTVIAGGLPVTVPPSCAGYPVSYTLQGATTGQGNGQLPLGQAFAKGVTTVTYTVTDDSGQSSSSCSFTVSVADNEPPELVCPSGSNINLPAGCQTTVAGTAPSLVSDNCSYTLSYALDGATQAAGSGQAPAGQLFSTGTTTVTYTLTDSSTAAVQCSFTVTVIETTPPQITCPANQTLATGPACTVPLPDYRALAQASDNCTPDTAIARTQLPAAGAVLNGLGAHTVELTATDGPGNSATCTFTVTVVDTTTLQIVCPPAQQVCDGLIGNYAALATLNSGCLPPAQVNVAQAPVANTAIPAYNGSLTVTLTATAGQQSATCTFTVAWADTTPPQAVCKNATAAIQPNGQATIAINDINDGSSDNCGIQGFALSISAFNCVNLGANTVSLTATDVHGLTASCTATVTVQDLLPPTLTCPANQSVAATSSNPCSAAVAGINASFSDNCAGAALSFVLSGATAGNGNGQASGQVFNTGVTTVAYTATDGAALSSACTFTVTVASCQVEFSGAIIWEHNNTSGVNNAVVSLTGAGAGSDTTDVAGNYLISIPNTTGNFILKPVKNTNKLNGLTTADATAIQQHVGNINLLPGPFKRIAADVNKTNTITTLDASLISQALLGSPAALNQITSWRFVPAAYTFPNPAVPWGFPEQINLTGQSGNASGQNFLGIKLGDVVSAWANPANFGKGEPLELQVQDLALHAGSDFTAEFRAGQLHDLSSFQYTLNFDPQQLHLLEIIPLATGLPLSLEHFGVFSLADGEIRVVWAGPAGVSLDEATPLFRLRFRALATGARLSEVLRLDDADDAELPAYTYNSAFAESGVELRYWEDTGTGGPLPGMPLECRPNPFGASTTLAFSLPESCAGQLRVFDATGKELLRRDRSWPAGRNTEVLRSEELSATGVLYGELITPFGKGIVRIVCLDR